HFVHIFNQIDLRLQRVSDSPPQRKAVTRSARAAALRSTALATRLVLAVGLSAISVDAWAKPKVPLPKQRPIARNVVPKTTPVNAARNSTPAEAAAPAVRAATAPAPSMPVPAPALAPATRQHAALPAARKPVATAAVAATSSTSQ